MQALTPVFAFSDLRHRAKEILNTLTDSPIILTLRGRPRAVLVDYETYNEFVKARQALEDVRDASLLQRAHETATDFVPLEALLQQHKELFGEPIELPTEPIA